MDWSYFSNLLNTDSVLEHKAYILARLVLGVSKNFHTIAAASVEVPFERFDAEFSEAEHAALYVAMILTFVRCYLDHHTFDKLSKQVLTVVFTYLRVKEPLGTFATHFLSRYEKLSAMTNWNESREDFGMSPWMQAHYNEQCKILGLQENALLYAIAENQVYENTERWDLYKLFTGNNSTK